LFAVKNARALNVRLNETDTRTRDYDHEKQEYEIGRLSRTAEEQEKRLVELNGTLAAQRAEIARRDKLYAEQTAMVLESSESIKLFEAVLTKKQRNQLMRKRELLGSGGIATSGVGDDIHDDVGDDLSTDAVQEMDPVGSVSVVAEDAVQENDIS